MSGPISIFRSLIEHCCVNYRRTLSYKGIGTGFILGFAAFAVVGQPSKSAYADSSVSSSPQPVVTSETDAVRTITIEMESLSFKPKQISVTAGETIRFILHNIGDIPHDFTIGTPVVQEGRRAVMRELFDADILQEYLADAPPRDGPNSVIILGGETRELIWTFTETQEIEFGCNLPLHYEAGMRGDINVSVPHKAGEVAAHDHDHGHTPEGKTDTASGGTAGGLANLAQIMAKAKEASEETTDSPDGAPSSMSASNEKAKPEETGQSKSGAKETGGEPENVASSPPANDPVSADASNSAAFDQGLVLLSEGDIIGARVAFQKSKTAEAALALGRSYDEEYLSRIEAPNAGPDASTARRWYEAWYRISVKQGAISAETNLDLLIEAITK